MSNGERSPAPKPAPAPFIGIVVLGAVALGWDRIARNFQKQWEEHIGPFLTKAIIFGVMVLGITGAILLVLWGAPLAWRKLREARKRRADELEAWHRTLDAAIEAAHRADAEVTQLNRCYWRLSDEVKLLKEQFKDATRSMDPPKTAVDEIIDR